MKLGLEKSKQKLGQTEKVQWVQHAIARAQELGDQEALKELNKRLYMIAPRFKPEIREKDFLTVAADFRANRQFERAREFYEKVLNSSFYKLDDKVAALKGIRLSYKNARDDDAHLKAALRLVEYMRAAEKLNPKSTSVRYTTPLEERIRRLESLAI